MNLFDRYLLKQLFPPLLFTLLGLTVILAIADMAGYLYVLTDRDAPLQEILILLVLAMPQALIYALPVSMLFSVCFVTASLYAHHELIAMLNSGVAFKRLVLPILMAALLLSTVSLLFQETIQIPASARQSHKLQELTGRSPSFDNQRVTLWNNSAEILYYASRYREQDQVLNDVTVIIYDETLPAERIDASRASYQHGIWELEAVRHYDLRPDDPLLTSYSVLSDPRLTEPPRMFRAQVFDIAHMRFAEALGFIRRLERIDAQNAREALTDLYDRVVFSFTPLLVALLSVSFGSRLKKNILLLSIFFSLGVSVLYYSFQFFCMILARQGVLPPAAGSLLPLVTFCILSLVLFHRVHT